MRYLWFNYFKEVMDGFWTTDQYLQKLKEYFFRCEWYEVYDLLEIIIGYLKMKDLNDTINYILERELSGYRCVEGLFVEITNQQEIDALEIALRDSDFPGVKAHLQRSLELLSDRNNPDYRNSIKESISAVESIARAITGQNKATLGDALKAIASSSNLHSALKDGFLKLYGYTSDEGGIRHAMLDDPSLTAADAKYFLLSCTSFINYLKSKV